MSLTLAGHNLGLWTDYTGFDPELNAAGQANLETLGGATQPPTRSYSVRLTVTW